MHTTMPGGLWCLALLPRRVNTLRLADRCRRGAAIICSPLGAKSMHLVKLFRRFRKDTDGVAAMEYGVIAGFISLVIVAGLLIATPAIKPDLQHDRQLPSSSPALTGGAFLL